MRRCPALLLTLVLVATACSGNGDDPSTPAELGGTLSPEETTVRWSGEFSELATPLFGGDIEDLRLRGETVALDVALGDDYWEENRGGSVHVGIRWNDPDELAHRFTGNAFSLYVVDAEGEVVAESPAEPGDPAAAQGVDAGRLRDGRYQVVVVPNQTQGVPYQGVAFVNAPDDDDLLPDLVPRPPTNFTFTATRAQPDAENKSCLEIERLGKPSLERCLRFDATIANIGRGPFIAEADITEAVDQRRQTIDAGTEPEGDMAQIVQEGEGERRVPAGRWVIDREHVHTHLVDFSSFELYRVDGDRGDRPLVTDQKIGFCPWDLVDDRFGKTGATGRVFGLPNCRVPSERNGDEPVVLRIGLSAGWSDIYPAHRSIQYLDATDLQDGIYDVVLRVDPNGWYEESDTSNNEAATRIRIVGDTITCVREPYGCPSNVTADGR